MSQTVDEIEKSFLEYSKKLNGYQEAIGLMYWDLRTGAPKKGIEQRSETIGQLSEDAFKMSVSSEVKSYIDQLTETNFQDQLSEITKKAVEECKKEYDRNTKIPAKEFREYVILQSNAESMWEGARDKSDFSMFQPYLEKIVEYKKRFVNYWGHDGNPYNTLLDLYEPGMTVDVIDRVFGQVREHIVPLLQSVVEARDKPQTSFLFKSFPEQNQRKFTIEMLKNMGFDFDAGRLDNTIHPFATGLNPGDVRITTRYDENDFRMAVFGTIHEGGHAIYEQNISKKLAGTLLCGGASMGIHESQSLFWENFVGRNQSFWENQYETLKKYANGQFDGVSLDDYYRAINVAGPSLIRIEADEMTYPLHIMVRYEIEKGLFNDQIAVKGVST